VCLAFRYSQHQNSAHVLFTPDHADLRIAGGHSASRDASPSVVRLLSRGKPPSPTSSSKHTTSFSLSPSAHGLLHRPFYIYSRSRPAAYANTHTCVPNHSSLVLVTFLSLLTAAVARKSSPPPTADRDSLCFSASHSLYMEKKSCCSSPLLLDVLFLRNSSCFPQTQRLLPVLFSAPLHRCQPPTSPFISYIFISTYVLLFSSAFFWRASIF